MLSQTAEYALRAVVHLAERYPEGPTRVDDIAEALGVPRNYLSKILHSLVKGGVCASTRGPHGGFELLRNPTEIPLIDVVGQFDPALGSADRVCLLGRTTCSDEDPCAAHERWGGVRNTVIAFFGDTTVDHLVRRSAA
jgi:Rrf2 family protein